MSYCENCGKEVSSTANFCSRCGNELNKPVDLSVTVVKKTVKELKCYHCDGTGKCNVQVGNFSCSVCMEYNGVTKKERRLPCSVCKGIGTVLIEV